MISQEAFFNKVDNAISTAVNAWLGTVISHPSAHQAGIVLGALLGGSNAVTDVRPFGHTQKWLSSVVAVIGLPASPLTAISEIISSGFTSAVASETNALLDELKNPNIEGIPIHADKEAEHFTITVAKQLLINQKTQNKEYMTDTASPQLKTWSIHGYLMSNPHLAKVDGNLIIKPGLIMQKTLLQLYADSGKPVWFKTHDNHFYKVLISNMQTNYNINGLNGIEINLELTEFKALELTDNESPIIVARSA